MYYLINLYNFILFFRKILEIINLIFNILIQLDVKPNIQTYNAQLLHNLPYDPLPNYSHYGIQPNNIYFSLFIDKLGINKNFEKIQHELNNGIL